VSDGAIILLAILRSLDGMLSKPAAFLSFSVANSLRTTLTGGSFREKVVLVASRQDSGSTLDDGISEVRFTPTLEKCRLVFRLSQKIQSWFASYFRNIPHFIWMSRRQIIN